MALSPQQQQEARDRKAAESTLKKEYRAIAGSVAIEDLLAKLDHMYQLEYSKAVSNSDNPVISTVALQRADVSDTIRMYLRQQMQ